MSGAMDAMQVGTIAEEATLGVRWCWRPRIRDRDEWMPAGTERQTRHDKRHPRDRSLA
jgi:hypothetical protein